MSMRIGLTLCLLLLSFQLHAQEHEYQLTVQVTDTESSAPAGEITAVLYRFGETSTAWRHVDTKVTDQSGLIDDFLKGLDHQGVYRLVLRTGRYFEQNGKRRFYPLLPIVLSVESGQPVHLRVIISNDGYSISLADTTLTDN